MEYLPPPQEVHWTLPLADKTEATPSWYQGIKRQLIEAFSLFLEKAEKEDSSLSSQLEAVATDKLARMEQAVSLLMDCGAYQVEGVAQAFGQLVASQERREEKKGCLASCASSSRETELSRLSGRLIAEWAEKREEATFSQVCTALAELHRKEERWALFHSFSSLAHRANGLPQEERELLVQAFVLLGQLYEAVAYFQEQAYRWMDSFHSSSEGVAPLAAEMEELFGELIEAIERTNQAERELFFQELMDKTGEEELLQTLIAIYGHELNKVASFLRRLFDEGALDEEKALLCGKKIAIFTCNFGTGHKVTAEALRQLVEKGRGKATIYDLSIGALLGSDPIRRIAKVLDIDYDDHSLNSTDLFNEILRRQLFVFINTQEFIEDAIRELLEMPGKHNVDQPLGLSKNSWKKSQLRDLLLLDGAQQVITSYHMDLNPVIEVAEELGLPVLHVPTDYNMKFYEVFPHSPTSYPHFHSLVPNQAIPATEASSSPLPYYRFIEGVGIPLRPALYRSMDEHERRSYRQSHGIAPEERIVCLSAGGNGQELPHPELLANSKSWDLPLRLVVVAGKNRSFVNQLRKKLVADETNPLLLRGSNPQVTIEILTNSEPASQGTEREFVVSASQLSKLFEVADAAIAKAGGVSVAELLFKGVPILFDQRKTPFSWELFNIEVVTAEQRGSSNKQLDQLELDLKNILTFSKQTSGPFQFQEPGGRLLRALHAQLQSAQEDNLAVRRQGNSWWWEKLHQGGAFSSWRPSAAVLARQELAASSPEELDRDWHLKDYFGQIKVISGNIHSERFARCVAELEQIGLQPADYQIAPGVDGSTIDPAIWKRANNWQWYDTDAQKQGRTGCMMAHYRAIEETYERYKEAQEELHQLRMEQEADKGLIQQAKERLASYSSLLLIEDNAGFGQVTGDQTASLEGVGTQLRQLLSGLPEDWDLFYLVTMADEWGPSEQITEELVRLRYGVLTKCYAIQAKMYPVILRYFDKVLSGRGPIYPVDHLLADLQRDHYCYAPKGQQLAYRFGSVSEVQGMDKPVEIKNWQPALHKVEEADSRSLWATLVSTLSGWFRR